MLRLWRRKIDVALLAELLVNGLDEQFAELSGSPWFQNLGPSERSRLTMQLYFVQLQSVKAGILSSTTPGAWLREVLIREVHDAASQFLSDLMDEQSAFVTAEACLTEYAGAWLKAMAEPDRESSSDAAVELIWLALEKARLSDLRENPDAMKDLGRLTGRAAGGAEGTLLVAQRRFRIVR